MSARRRLPNRRPCLTFDDTLAGVLCAVSYGYDHKLKAGETGKVAFPQSPVKEIFINGPKSGTMLESIMRDGATSVSVAMQRGAEPAELANSLTREPDGTAASPIGAVLDDLVSSLPVSATTN